MEQPRHWEKLRFLSFSVPQPDAAISSFASPKKPVMELMRISRICTLGSARLTFDNFIPPLLSTGGASPCKNKEALPHGFPCCKTSGLSGQFSDFNLIFSLRSIWISHYPE